jgi:hypothetical protein
MIMCLITLLLFATTISSCGLPFASDLVRKKGAAETRLHSSTDPALVSYVTKFEQQAQAAFGNSAFTVGDIPVNFGDTENSLFQGVCFTYANGQSEIIIRKGFWDSANESLRESLLFHELGHCRLGREHDNAVVASSNKEIKASLMNQVIVGSNDYNQYKSAYMSELFKESKSELYALLGIASN